MKRRLLALVLSLLMLFSMMPLTGLAEGTVTTPSEPVADSSSTYAFPGFPDLFPSWPTTAPTTAPTVAPTEKPDVNKDHVFGHIDVRIASAQLVITHVTKDADGSVISSKSETITANVTNVHSVKVDGVTYTGFKKSGTYEYRKTSGVSIVYKNLDDDSSAELLVDLVDAKTGKTYSNVKVVYGYDGIIAAAENCDGFNSWSGRYDGLDFDVSTNQEYTVTIVSTGIEIPVTKMESVGGQTHAYTGKGGDVTFRLSDGTSSSTATVSANGTAKFSLSYNSSDIGRTYSYTLTEVNVPGRYEANTTAYTFTVKVNSTTDKSGNVTLTAVPTGVPQDGFVFTNTVKTTSLSASKVWSDGNDQDGIRPDSITLQLKANGKAYGDAVSVTAADGWTYEWTNLPEYDAQSNAIVYTVEETNVPEGYEVSYNGTVITNTYTPATTTFTATKTWSDSNDQDGIRPNSVSVQLMANGEAYGEKVVLNEENSWSYTWDNLPKFNGGNAVTYSVVEDAVDGYTASYNGGNITNTYTPATTTFTATKTWSDGNDQDGIRPESVSVQLMANGEAYGEKVVLNDENSWSYTWDNLPKFNGGNAVTYSVVEDAVDGYTASYNGGDITNTHETETTSISVNKVWVDEDDRDGVRPDSISVQLYANGQPYGEAVTLTAPDWAYTWENLAVNKDGAQIEYTIGEAAVEGYTSEMVLKDKTFVLTNTHSVEKTTVTVEKRWEDDNNRDGIRPSSIVVQLYGNDNLYGQITLTAEMGWTYTWTGLNMNENGQPIEYSVVEVDTGDSENPYEVSYDGYLIINSYEPETTSINVAKIWDDENDFDGMRPESVSVQLYADGQPVGDAITLCENNGWEYTWNQLYVNSNGKAIVYNVKEVSTVKGYTATIVGDAEAGFVIVNSHEISTTSKTVQKYWDDNNDSEKLRPTSVKVQLYANDEPYGSAVILTAETGWTYTWEDLPNFIDGEQVKYTARELEIADGYYAKYSKNGFVITNVHNIIPKTGSASVSAMWWALAAISIVAIAGVLSTNGKKRRSH